jgi:geranylgeranyl reductase family protein
MIEKFRYDVTVVGAGPAGSVLAYELARRGVKVLLLEKNKIPRHKVCAGGITVRAASLLPRSIDSVVEGVIYGARLSYNKVPKKIRTYESPIIYTVRRDKFDYLLASLAREAGVVVKESSEVKNVEINKDIVEVKTESESFSATVVVGADGANSVVVRSLGLGKGFRYGLGVNGDIEVTSRELLNWENLIGLDYGMFGGYSWVFPKSTCLSIGSGGSFRVARRLRPYAAALMKSCGLVNVDGNIIRGHLMPVRKSTAPISRNRILLVGDAAGLIDPLTGEGIYYALRSSYLAVSVILSFLEGKSGDLSDYDEAVNHEFSQEFKIAQTLREMNNLAPQFFFHWLKDSDRFWRAFCQLLRGERTYASLKSRLSPPPQLLFR